MKRSSLLNTTFFFSFFVYLHLNLFLYINASVLEKHLSVAQVGLLFSLASLGTMCALLYVPRILERVGTIRATIIALILEVVALFGMVFSHSVALIIISFFAYQILIYTLSLQLDIIFESLSLNELTGRLRGLLISLVNASILIASLFAGFVLGDTTAFERVFIIAVLALIPVLIPLLSIARAYQEPKHVRGRILPAVRAVLTKPNLRNIFLANVLLRAFYAVMVVYMGLYLHDTIGMEWDAIGVVFAIMLVPFLILEYPLGRLADTRIGEKEILSLGFIVMGLATIALGFITSTSIVVWGIALFCTRIGAATVESMTESYFFKQVNASDTNIIGLYRTISPLGYIVAPLLASLLFLAYPMHYIFFALGGAIFLALIPTLRLQDTK